MYTRIPSCARDCAAERVVELSCGSATALIATASALRHYSVRRVRATRPSARSRRRQALRPNSGGRKQRTRCDIIVIFHLYRIENSNESRCFDVRSSRPTPSTSVDACERRRQSNGRSISLAKKQLQKSLERIGRVLGVGKFASGPGAVLRNENDYEQNVDAFQQLQNLPGVMEQCEKTMSEQQELVKTLAAELSRERQLNFKQTSVLFHLLRSRPFVFTFVSCFPSLKTS